jgi:LPXTG-motif cell wall-anchored protein
VKAFALALGVVMLTATAAQASDNVIPWEGQGSDNLPCSSGGHWVLAPAFGIDSAVLTVEGTDYVMTQNGNGSWSADSVGAIDEDVDAYVTFTGDGDERDHLQLSHCTDSSPSPSESPSETPSETPSESPSESTSLIPPTSGTNKPSASVLARSHGPSIRPLAETGGSVGTPLAIGGVLLVLGLGSLFLRRRFS